jgi:hypothetical protein
MVDYCICLAPSLPLEDAIIAKLRSESTPSINHTRAEFVRFKPVAISIETKRPGMDEDAGEVQLGVWAAAHFERLKQLSGHSGDGNGDNLPILPQIFVQGHDWRFKIAAVHCGGSVVRFVPAIAD